MVLTRVQWRWRSRSLLLSSLTSASDVLDENENPETFIKSVFALWPPWQCHFGTKLKSIGTVKRVYETIESRDTIKPLSAQLPILG